MRRAAAAQPVLFTDRGSWTVVRQDSELFVTGAADQLPVDAPVRSLFALKKEGAVFYGWPVLVVTDRKGKRRVAPLVVTELQPPAPGVHHTVARDGEPHLNAALTSTEFFSAEAVAAVAAVAAGGLAFGDPEAITRQLQGVLGALGRDGGGLDSRRLTWRQPVDTVGVHNVAMAFHGPSDIMTRGLVAELTALRDRTDWTGTAAQYLLDPAPTVELDDLPAPAAPLVLNDSQEQALRESGSAHVTAVTGPPGTGKSHLVAAVVAGAWLRGDTVLVASTNNEAVRAAVEKTVAVDHGAVVRTGNQDARKELPKVLRSLMHRSSPAGVSADVCRRSLDAAIAQRVRLHERLEARGRAETELAQLVLDLERLRILLWGSPGPSPVLRRRAELAFRAGRASRARWFRSTRVRLALRAAQLPDGHAADIEDVAAWAEREVRWDIAMRALRTSPPRDEPTERAALAAADAEWADATRAAVERAVSAALATARPALEHLASSRIGARASWVQGVAATLPTVAGWACTTLSAQSNFPLTAGLFDLLVVDEASQCSVADVLPMAYRARRIVVVGDPHQLAPVVKLSEQDLAAVASSVDVDEATMKADHVSYRVDSAFSAVVGRSARSPHLLDQHYRCHPEIAAYINEVFYSGALRVLTDPTRDPAGVQGLHWYQVTGETRADRISGAVNDAEVDAVVRWVLDHADEPGTLGVVTPFAAQAARLRDRLAAAMSPELRAERELMVGTAHTFQGAERDLVLFSTVLSRGVGLRTARWVEAQRNLVNVAVSRARRALVVVGDAEAICALPVPTLHALVRTTTGDGTVFTDDVREDARLHSEAERRLFTALGALGLDVVPKPVVSGYELDFAVRLPDGRRVDVECDGSQHVDPRGRQRRQDLARDQVVRGLGWEVRRFAAWRCLIEPEQVAAEVAGT